MFLCTSMLVLVAFLSMSVFTLVVDKGWLDESIATQINFIPMVSVIVAYVGYGLGYGVIPSLIAAETMPVGNSVSFYLLQSLIPFPYN